jgi:hypothetical protein
LLRDLPVTMLISIYYKALVRELFSHTIVMNEGLIFTDVLTVKILEDGELHLWVSVIL